MLIEKLKKVQFKHILILAVIITLTVAYIIDEINLSSSRISNKPDSELFSNFYSDIMVKAKVIDDAFLPFGAALEKFDVDEAEKIAKARIGILISSWTEIKDISVPTLANKSAQSTLTRAKEVLVSAYGYKVRIVGNFLESLDNRSLDQLQQGVTYADNYQSQLFTAMMLMYQAGNEVGVNLSDIGSR